MPYTGFGTAAFDAELDGDQLYLRGLVGEPDGSRTLRAEVRGAGADAHALVAHDPQQLPRYR